MYKSRAPLWRTYSEVLVDVYCIGSVSQLYIGILSMKVSSRRPAMISSSKRGILLLGKRHVSLISEVRYTAIASAKLQIMLSLQVLAITLLYGYVTCG